MQWDSTQIKLPGDEEEDYCTISKDYDDDDDDGHNVDGDDDDEDDDEECVYSPMVPLGTNSAASFPENHRLRSKPCSNDNVLLFIYNRF